MQKKIFFFLYDKIQIFSIEMSFFKFKNAQVLKVNQAYICYHECDECLFEGQMRHCMQLTWEAAQKLHEQCVHLRWVVAQGGAKLCTIG